MNFQISRTNVAQFILTVILFWPFFLWYRFLYILIIIYGILSYESTLSVKKDIIRIVPILLLICWLYGECLGLARGNGWDAIENFFGMSLLITANSTKLGSVGQNSKLVKNIVYAGVIQVPYFVIYTFIEGIPIEVYFLRGFTDIGDFRVEYNASVILSSIAFFLLLRKEWASNVVTSIPLRVIYILLALAAVIMSGSKGYYAAFALMFFAYCFVTLRLRANLIRFATLVVLIVFIAAALPYQLIKDSYSADEISNSRRDEQAPYILSEVTVIGAGLGSGLKSGYFRGVSYGAELTYHSILHKFGLICGCIIFFSYLTIWLNSAYLMLKAPNSNRFISFSLLCILIPAYGNPSLFSPLSIVAFIIAFRILCIERLRLPTHI